MRTGTGMSEIAWTWDWAQPEAQAQTVTESHRSRKQYFTAHESQPTSPHRNLKLCYKKKTGNQQS